MSLLDNKKEEIRQKTRLITIEAMELFKYKKKDRNYENKEKLHDQVVNKTISIFKAFYPGCYFIFLLKNANSVFAYCTFTLHSKRIKKVK